MPGAKHGVVKLEPALCCSFDFINWDLNVNASVHTIPSPLELTSSVPPIRSSNRLTRPIPCRLELHDQILSGRQL